MTFPSNLVYVTGVAPNKGDIAALFEERQAFYFATADDLRAESPTVNVLSFVDDVLYRYDPTDSTSVDDLSDFPLVLTTANDHRYKPVDVSPSSQLLGNAMINGDMSIWQRGVGPFTAFGYSADRYLNIPGTGATVSIDQRPGLTLDAEFSLGWNRTVAGTTACLIDQRIEDVRSFEGRQITVSFDAQSITSSITMRMSLLQNFGSGGSAAVSTATNVFTITTAVQRFSVTIDVPSVSGKTIGASSFISARLFRNSTDEDGDIRIGDVKIEAGGAPTPFTARPPAAEMDLVQRYYQKSYDAGTAPGAVTATGAQAEAARTTSLLYTRSQRLLKRMRAAPTITLYSTVTGTSGQARDVTAAADVAVSAAAISERGFEISGGGNFVADNDYAAQWVADAEL